MTWTSSWLRRFTNFCYWKYPRCRWLGTYKQPKSTCSLFFLLHLRSSFTSLWFVLSTTAQSTASQPWKDHENIVVWCHTVSDLKSLHACMKPNRLPRRYTPNTCMKSACATWLKACLTWHTKSWASASPQNIWWHRFFIPVYMAWCFQSHLVMAMPEPHCSKNPSCNLLRSPFCPKIILETTKSFTSKSNLWHLNTERHPCWHSATTSHFEFAQCLELLIGRVHKTANFRESRMSIRPMRVQARLKMVFFLLYIYMHH